MALAYDIERCSLFKLVGHTKVHAEVNYKGCYFVGKIVTYPLVIMSFNLPTSFQWIAIFEGLSGSITGSFC